MGVRAENTHTHPLFTLTLKYNTNTSRLFTHLIDDDIYEKQHDVSLKRINEIATARMIGMLPT